MLYFFISVCSDLGVNPSNFPRFPVASGGPTLTSPSSLGGSPLHMPTGGWSSSAPRPSAPASSTATMFNSGAKTPSDGQADYSRTNFDSVFGRSDYGCC